MANQILAKWLGINIIIIMNNGDKRYKKRIVDEILIEKLLSKGAVVIEGPKWCGKTTTASQVAKSVLRVDEPSKKETNILLSKIDPQKLLNGDTPRLIDEWQITPTLWDAIRFEIDSRSKEGQFILTGSSVPVDSLSISHSGTGRFTWLKMRTMSLYESSESSGEVSLLNLFSNPVSISGINKLNLDDIAFLICRGGWPRAIDMKDNIALNQAEDYFDSIVKSDINRADGVNKNIDRVTRLMKSLARHQGTSISNARIKDDIKVNDESNLNEYTIASYINALRNIFVIEDMPAWNPNLRSKTAIRTSDNRYFIDPSIAVASLGVGPTDLINDIKTMGLFFETLCVRDLRIYAESIKGSVYHYKDKSGLECDAVIHLKNGKYGLIEIKLGGTDLIEEAAKNLNALEDKIDTSKMNSPSFKMILIGVGDYAFKREDGIFVVPIGCLKN